MGLLSCHGGGEIEISGPQAHAPLELVSQAVVVVVVVVLLLLLGVTHLLMLAKRAPGNITSPRCSNRSHQETSEQTDSNQKQAFSTAWLRDKSQASPGTS